MASLTKEDKNFYRAFQNSQAKISKSFVNSNPLISNIGENRSFTITDVVALAVLSKTNMYFMGSRGGGKTLTAEAVHKGIFDEKGFYLRGDVNLQLKDLFMKLDLYGKTDDEIFKISESKNFNFVLIDELNRVPPVVQNQFLNLLDGYIEIRGKRYQLGEEGYLLAIATGNPPSDSDDESYGGTFGEDLALMDRIPLIINFDEVQLNTGDVYAISDSAVEKSKLQNFNLIADVLEAHRYLKHGMESDSEMRITLSLIKELVYYWFRYIEIKDAERVTIERIDKAQFRDWRAWTAKIKEQHADGTLISYCSDISVRTLEHVGRLAFALFTVADLEARLTIQADESQEETKMKDFIRAYLESLRLALNYDRRFIKPDLLEERDISHPKFTESVFNEISGRLDPSCVAAAVVILQEFFDEKRKRNLVAMKKLYDFTKAGITSQPKTTDPMLEITCNLMDQEMKKLERGNYSKIINAGLEDK